MSFPKEQKFEKFHPSSDYLQRLAQKMYKYL